MKIYLDLTESKVSKVSLREKGQIIEEMIGPSPLPLINDLLLKHSLKISDLSEIDVNPGPGSYTGIKISIAIADTLNFVLGISKKIRPIYEAKT